MYSYEIRKFVSDRNSQLNRTEFGEVINSIDNPQIKSVKVVKEESHYNVSISVSDEDSPIIFIVNDEGLTTYEPFVPKYV